MFTLVPALCFAEEVHGQGINVEEFQTRLAKMHKSREWGDERELQAVSDIYGLIIYVWLLDLEDGLKENGMRIKPRQEVLLSSERRIVHFYHKDRNHYDVLTPLDEVRRTCKVLCE